MKIAVVTGGRTYSDYDAVNDALESVGECVIVQGGAAGADRLARDYAVEACMPLFTVPARWADGKRAGPVRNRLMLLYAQKLGHALECDVIVLAFPGGRGTMDCLKQADALGLEIHDYG